MSGGSRTRAALKDTFRNAFLPQNYAQPGDTPGNDTAAIQRAIEAAIAAGGGTVFCDSSKPWIIDPIVLDGRCNFLGEGMQKTKFFPATTSNSITGPLISFAPSTSTTKGCEVGSFTVDNTHSRMATGLQIQNSDGCYVHDVETRYGRYGVVSGDATTGLTCTFERIYANNAWDAGIFNQCTSISSGSTTSPITSWQDCYTQITDKTMMQRYGFKETGSSGGTIMRNVQNLSPASGPDLLKTIVFGGTWNNGDTFTLTLIDDAAGTSNTSVTYSTTPATLNANISAAVTTILTAMYPTPPAAPPAPTAYTTWAGCCTVTNSGATVTLDFNAELIYQTFSLKATTTSISGAGTAAVGGNTWLTVAAAGGGSGNFKLAVNGVATANIAYSAAPSTMAINMRNAIAALGSSYIDTVVVPFGPKGTSPNFYPGFTVILPAAVSTQAVTIDTQPTGTTLTAHGSTWTNLTDKGYASIEPDILSAFAGPFPIVDFLLSDTCFTAGLWLEDARGMQGRVWAGAGRVNNNAPGIYFDGGRDIQFYSPWITGTGVHIHGYKYGLYSNAAATATAGGSDGTLAAGTYRYGMTAVFADGVEWPMGFVTVNGGAITLAPNPSVVITSAQHVVLAGTAPANVAPGRVITGYNVYRSTAGGTTLGLIASGLTTPGYTDVGAASSVATFPNTPTQTGVIQLSSADCSETTFVNNLQGYTGKAAIMMPATGASTGAVPGDSVPSDLQLFGFYNYAGFGTYTSGVPSAGGLSNRLDLLTDSGSVAGNAPAFTNMEVLTDTGNAQNSFDLRNGSTGARIRQSVDRSGNPGWELNEDNSLRMLSIGRNPGILKLWNRLGTSRSTQIQRAIALHDNTSTPAIDIFSSGTSAVAGSVVSSLGDSGDWSGRTFAAAGLAGATQASRYAGATTSGAPVSGTFAVGDFVIDQSGVIWVCSTAGSPGTWARSGSSLTLSTAVPQLETSTGAAGTTGQASDAGHSHPLGLWTPADNGWAAASMNPDFASSGQLLATSGRLQVVRLHVPVAATATKIWIHLQTAGATLTSGQCFAALYSPAKALLAQSADQSAAWAGATGVQQITIASTVLTPGDYFIVLWANGTTMPKFLAGNNAAIVNGNLSAANSRYALADTTITTTGPGTLGTFTASGLAFFAALS